MALLDFQLYMAHPRPSTHNNKTLHIKVDLILVSTVIFSEFVFLVKESLLTAEINKVISHLRTSDKRLLTVEQSLTQH